MKSSPDASPTLDRLALVRVAKDVFLTDWYAESSGRMFEGEDLDVFARIAEETREERERAMNVMRVWSERRGAQGAGLDHLAATMKSDFVGMLIEIKQASGSVFHKAALIAPEEYREELLRLANIDLRHALELRDLAIRDLERSGPTTL